MSSHEVLRKLKFAGAEVVRIKGSHYQLKISGRNGTITVPHPRKDIRLGTLRSIERQAGIKF